ncbi:beta-phosphoglucomutase family hydrolase [Auritidibacter sp. NML120636]|uniref:beta-phosphoglucomutase family hydrolase n=1 Tax=Auritidibacter sp. NML120636 TaxID=2170743 RepID=UPI000D73529A|nr:beta-phosphoglucomutase family hydrolase [Auritidibacter sp. NML120636]PXA80622.1 HAD family hydrolase [Auritidibacter sp. NML120636]
MHPLSTSNQVTSSVGRHGLRHYRGVIFDMDGVVTKTVQVHAEAWKKLFDQALPAVGQLEMNREVVIADPNRLREFDVDSDYLQFVDGMPREDGVRNFFASRDLSVPERAHIGEDAETITPEAAADFEGELTVQGLAELKQSFFDKVLALDGVEVFADATEVLDKLRHERIPTAIVSSSRNAPNVLTAGGVIDYFDVIVDGNTALAEDLEGKPAPAMFLRAADEMGLEPEDMVVLEDAVSGVTAATAGEFGLVIGVDRLQDPGRLAEAGAHIVTDDLTSLKLDRRVTHDMDSRWVLNFTGYEPENEGTREALCTLANGYWGTRGSVPGTLASEVHYPGSYAAGVFNRLTTDLQGHVVETEHMVNLPDWTYVTITDDQGTLLSPTNPSLSLEDYHQHLDLRRGLLSRTIRYRTASGRITEVTTRQFQSMAGENLAAMQIKITAENWSGRVQVRSGINGRVANQNVTDDLQLANRHWEPVTAETLDPETVLLETVTSQSQVHVAIATRTRLTPGSPGSSAHNAEYSPELSRNLITGADELTIGHEIDLQVTAGEKLSLEKIAAMTTSRDHAISTPAINSSKRINRVKSFRDLLSYHEKMWGVLWSKFAVEIDFGRPIDITRTAPVDTMASDRPLLRHQLALNVHTFHVLQTVFGNREELDASVPARGLHGEGYRGHLFWDELYIHPMLILRRPEYTRGLLLYRYRRLGEARAMAAAEGYDGAMYPWQSGSDGREETPTELWNPRSQMWMPDNSHRQRHVSLAIAYSVLRYLEATHDESFLSDYGAEMLVEICRFFVSLTSYDPATDRYSIHGVMGPDEYHDGYPDTPGSGLSNNAYTNMLLAWVLQSTIEWLRYLEKRNDPVGNWLDLFVEEVASWEDVASKLTVPFMEVSGRHIIAQFEGYQDLLEFDWEGYRAKYGNIGRLDLILQAEGDTTNRYKLSKQADTLMLTYLFSAEELYDMLSRLGYEYTVEDHEATVDYYLHRTSHGSSLSRLVHGWVAARIDRSNSWKLFTEGMEVDLSDTQGGTTREGVHLGLMAGSVDMVIRGYAGVETRGNMLRLNPQLPEELPGVKFSLLVQRQPLVVELTHERAELTLLDAASHPLDVIVQDQQQQLAPGQTWSVELVDA